MAVGGDEAKRQGVIGRPLDLAAGVAAGGVAVDEQRQQGGGVIGLATPPGVSLLQRTQIQSLHDLDDVAREVPFGQPILHRGRQQKIDVAVDGTEVAHRLRP